MNIHLEFAKNLDVYNGAIMKKFLKNNEFEKHIEPYILNRGKIYYNENRILDIWYQENKILAYVDGTEIYKVELEIKNDEILNYYCSCPYSEEGNYMCKHIVAVLCYLKDNQIPELEKSKSKKKNRNEIKTELNIIYDKMESELKRISDRNGFVNYYNGRYFVDLIYNVSNYIERFIDNKEYDDALELIKYTYYFIKNTFMDGSNGEYQDSLNQLCTVTSKLLYIDKYFEEFLYWAKKVADNNELNDFSDAPLYAYVLFAYDKKSAEKVVKILDGSEFLYGIFINKKIDIITLTYEFIDKEKAIRLCYQNIDDYGAKKLLIEYLKSEKRIDEVIKILKDDIKNHARKDMTYDRLLKVYEEFGMLNEKKKILPEVIIETNNFDRYKELKSMCDDNEWKELKEKIISKIKPNNRWILEDIYMEESEIDKLFELIKKDYNLGKLVRYQDALKSKYSSELLNFYKSEILKEVTYASDRNRYRSICEYIKKMDELDNSSVFIFEMIKEMYPIYRNKSAFKEEIMNALNKENKEKFINLITNKMEVK